MLQVYVADEMLLFDNRSEEQLNDTLFLVAHRLVELQTQSKFNITYSRMY